MKTEIKGLYLLLLIFSHVVYAEIDYRVENTNITISHGSEFLNENKTYMYNYNRLRFNADYSEEKYFATVIADAVNYLGHSYVKSNTFSSLKLSRSDTPFSTQSNFKDYGDGSVYVKLYRAYGGYEDSENRVVLGLQNITMGVGRIWTPTNIFNPKNTYALESDEVFGVYALAYTRHMDKTSQITFVASQKQDHSFKYAARYKTFLDVADFAINLVGSSDTKMLGYELEGDLADTGVELRSEGAYIRHAFLTSAGEDDIGFFQGLVGADYGFVNGISVVLEALYSSKEFSYDELVLNSESDILSNLVGSKFHTGVTLSYSFNIFLDASLLYIESFDEKNTRFVSPSLKYTLNDNNYFIIGAMIQDGDAKSEFGSLENTYYFKWTLSF